MSWILNIKAADFGFKFFLGPLKTSLKLTTKAVIDSGYYWFAGRRNLLKVSYFEMSFWCLQISQKNNEIVLWISALSSKKRSNQKIRALYTNNCRILFWLSYTWFDHFLESRAEILKKFNVKNSEKFSYQLIWCSMASAEALVRTAVRTQYVDFRHPHPVLLNRQNFGLNFSFHPRN